MTAGAEIVCSEVVCKVETMEKCGSGLNAVAVLLLLIWKGIHVAGGGNVRRRLWMGMSLGSCCSL
ncbi:hypothetical protein Hanom_Chr15g01414631 [Helianthus anomalus]